MSKTINATQNEDGTYRIVITTPVSEAVIEKANIYITTYETIKDDKKLRIFTLKECRL